MTPSGSRNVEPRSGTLQTSRCPTTRRRSEITRDRGDRVANTTQGVDEFVELPGGESGQRRGSGLDDLREQPVQYGLGRGGHVDEDPTAVIGVREALDVPVAFEGVEHAGHGASRDVHLSTDRSRRQRSPVPLDDGQGVERGMRQAMTTCHRSDECLSHATDLFEFPDDPGGDPRCTGEFLLERRLRRKIGRGSALAGTTPTPTRCRAQLRPPRRIRCGGHPAHRPSPCPRAAHRFRRRTGPAPAWGTGG